MAAVAAYAGGSWLQLGPLAAGLLLTAVLVWVRWKACLDEHEGGHAPAAERQARLD